MLKRITAFLCMFVLLMCIPLSANAAAAEIYGDTVYAEENSIFFVPVSIRNNPGIMGFKVSVTYDPEILTLPTISRGTVTQEGTINDGIGVSEDGYFDVVWCDAKNAVDDGTIFIISFNTTKKVEKSSTEISFSFSQPDTFNEKYEDVSFECQKAEVRFSAPPEGYYEGETLTSPSREPNCDDIVLAVDMALKEVGSDTISVVPEKKRKKLITSANDNILKITGFGEDFFAGTEDMEGKYTEAVKEKFVNDVIAAVDPKDIADIIDNALRKSDAEDIESLSDEKKSKFIESVESGLCEKAKDISNMKLDENSAVNVISDLQKSVNNIGTHSKQSKSKNILLILIFSLFIVLISIGVLKFEKKQRRKSNEKPY